MSRKFALVIGNTEYTDPGLRELTAPGKDAQDFARVLKDEALCAFDEVRVVVNEPSSTVIEAVDEFFDGKKPDDLLVLYFSGHGVRDELGSLYLAFKNTIRTRLRATAIKSDYIRESMDQSRSKRQVVVLDCCNSGAFPQGTKAEIGGPMGLTTAFQGYGRFVLMASDSTQFAWEGDRVIGETTNSLFTHYLVKGLEGEADSDGDGKITVDELYDYSFEQISKVTVKQTPTKAASKVEGDIVLRQITRLEDIKPIALPSDLLEELEDTRPYVRAAVVEKLERILNGKNLGMGRSAKAALERIIADENTTRRVADAAQQVLRSYQEREQKAEETTAPVEAPTLAAASAAVAEPPPAIPKAPELAREVAAKPEAARPVAAPRAALPGGRKLWIWVGAILGVIVLGYFASTLLPLGPTPTPSPYPAILTERAATEAAAAASTPPAANTATTAAENPGSPTALPTGAVVDQASAQSTVPATPPEPHIGDAAESMASWNGNAASIVDMAWNQNGKLDDSQPGTFSYPVSVSRSERVRWEWYWCAQTQAILENNLQSIDVKFELDGQDITPEVQHADFQNSGSYCRTFFVSVDNWPEGTFHLNDTLTIRSTVNDGSTDYAAGDYVYNYVVTAK